MLNEQYILNLIRPCLNSKRELSEFEFSELFSELNRQEQYEVINIMIKNDIDLVDEKEEETEELNRAEILRPSGEIKDHRKMMQLTNEQLCVMYQQGDETALAALVEKNKRFVYQIALKLSKEYNCLLTVDDLYMEGNIGLIEAAIKFDATKDYKFTTYSWHWIRQKIVRCAIDTGYMIRIPVHLFDVLIKVNNCRRRHIDASFNELLEYLRIEDDLGLSPGKLGELIAYSDLYMNTASLNEVIGEDGDSERIDFIADEEMDTESVVLGGCLKRDLMEVLSTLPVRERKVLDLRFGLTSGQEMTLEEVGEVFNVTRERIRQIEAKALKKLKHPSRKNKLEDYY